MDVHSHSFIADVSVALHVPLTIVIHSGPVLYRKNNWFTGHPFDRPFPVCFEYFTPVKLFISQHIVNRFGSGAVLAACPYRFGQHFHRPYKPLFQPGLVEIHIREFLPPEPFSKLR
jgi:hypothetical protein